MNPADNLHYDYPLVTVIINGHEPKWVEDVIKRVSELDNETLSLLMGFMIIVARDEVGRN